MNPSSEINETQAIALTGAILSKWLNASESEKSETNEPAVIDENQTIILLANLAGITPEQLEKQPELAKDSPYQLLNDFQQAVSDSLSGNQEKPDLARDRMRSLDTILKSQNIDLKMAVHTPQLAAIGISSPPTVRAASGSYT